MADPTGASHSAYVAYDYHYQNNIDPQQASQIINRSITSNVDAYDATVSDEYDVISCIYDGTLFDEFGHTRDSFTLGSASNVSDFTGTHIDDLLTFEKPQDDPQQVVLDDDAAWLRLTSYNKFQYGLYQDSGEYTQYNGLLINDVKIMWYNALTEEWEVKGYAYKDGVFYDTPLDLDNPYTDSEPEDDGGDGDADWSRTANVLRDLPDNFFTESGMVTVYTPTSAQLMALSDYLWSDNGLDLDQFKKIVNDPFDILMGLNYLPFKVTVAGTKGVNVGNILSVDTHLTMNYPTKENYTFSFGSVSLKEEMNAFCDYSPHSKLSIHLPFIGTQALDIDLIRRGKYNPYTFELVYKYNIVTGCVMAYLISSDGVVVYSWASNVATPIPMATNDYTNTINGLMGLATSAVSGAVTGGMLGGVPGAVGGALVGASTGGANTMSSLKPTVSTTGGIGSCAATLSPTLDAYFILEQPQMELDNKYKKYNGLPRNKSMKISNQNAYGYNEVDGIKLEVNRATQSEKEEIERILRSGYIYGTPASGKKAAHVNPRPTLPEQNAAQIALYQTTSSNMRIDKSCKHLHTYSNITMKEGTSITNPVITLCASDQNVCIANYAYIPKFHRYYYIEDVVNIGGHRFDEANQRDLYLWEIHLKCDVLMSHKSDIIDQTVIFKRSQAHYNLYLNDDRIQIDNRPHIYTRPFPNHLTNECTYVLLIAGHSVS